MFYIKSKKTYQHQLQSADETSKSRQANIDRIYLCVKDPFESSYQLLIKRCKKIKIKKLKNPTKLIEYSKTIDDVYEISKIIIQQRK